MLMFRFVQEVPAFIAVGVWFLFQIINGLGMLGGQSDGVAYAAHIGGFIAGFLLIRLFAVGTQNIEYQRSYSRGPDSF
jgi:membrane associated rhomboid family serine protease